MQLKYIWDVAETYEGLIHKAKDRLHRELKEEAWVYADRVLDKEFFMIASFSLTFDDFVRNVKAVAVSIAGGKVLDEVVKLRRNHEKNALDRCTPTDELEAIKEKGNMSEEMKQRLIREGKAAVCEGGIGVVHPLLVELANERYGKAETITFLFWG